MIIRNIALLVAIAAIALIPSACSSAAIAEGETYFNSGVAKHRAGNYKGAIADYDKALELNPQFAKAYSSRGAAKHKLGDYNGAISDYDKAIKLNPTFRDGLQPLIDAARAKKR